MSTRAHIRVKNESGEISLYCHCDGYPSGLGKVLKRFLDGFQPHFWEADWIVWKLIKGDISDDFFFNHDIFPTFGLHGDEDFVYVIDTIQKTINCYRRYPGETFNKCCTLENRRQI